VSERDHSQFSTEACSSLVRLEDFHALTEDLGHGGNDNIVEIVISASFWNRDWLDERREDGREGEVAELTIKDLLIFPASLSRSPVFPVFLVRSDPARSTMERREVCIEEMSCERGRNKDRKKVSFNASRSPFLLFIL